jgi:1-acyl-sn-glycerol-3-phosphate acyltransferase
MSTLMNILLHNPIDAYSAWNRRRLKKKGIVDKRDNQIYRHVGLRFFPKILWFTNKLTVEGTENIKKLARGGFIAVSNHQYALDPFFLGCMFNHENKIARKIAWVSKLENFTIPIQKSLVTPFGTIPLNKDRKMTPLTFKMIHEKLSKGVGVGMFPEGTRGDGTKIGNFHAGASRLALHYQVPYIPMAITGKRSFFKGTCHIRIGEPVFLDQNLECSYENAKEIAIDMQNQVQALFDGHVKSVPKCRFERKQGTLTSILGKRTPIKAAAFDY